MERGKERAELRSAGLRRLLLEMENKRDRLMDEVAHKQGEVSVAEATIKRIHEMILDINKEEKSALELEEKLQQQREEKKAQQEENRPRKEKAELVLNGKKNSSGGKKPEIIERARRARGRKRAKVND